MSKIKSLTIEGVRIPLSTPCQATPGRQITPACSIILQRDDCARGEIQQLYCTTCAEVVFQNVIR